MDLKPRLGGYYCGNTIAEFVLKHDLNYDLNYVLKHDLNYDLNYDTRGNTGTFQAASILRSKFILSLAVNVFTVTLSKH